MFVCVCVCMYVCMYVCTYVRTYVCMYVCMYVCIYVCMCAWINNIYIYILYTPVNTDVQLFHMYIYIYIQRIYRGVQGFVAVWHGARLYVFVCKSIHICAYFSQT